MKSRLLSALAFPCVILALVLLWSSRTARTPTQTTLYYTAAAAGVIVAGMAFRERHRKQ
jgi:hypothetical protein